MELQLTIILIAIVLMFLVMETPVMLVFLIPTLYKSAWFHVFTVMYITNHTTHFFTYFIVNADFREQVWRLLCCKTGKKLEQKTTISSLSQDVSKSSV